MDIHFNVEFTETTETLGKVGSLINRARKWPGFHDVEKRVVQILQTHPDFKSGPIDDLRLFKAYKLARKYHE